MRAHDGELWRCNATDLAVLIRGRQISCREVVEAHLRRIKAVDPVVNAIPVLLAEEALASADAADRAVAARHPLPPLHGVPFTVKGNIDIVGAPTTHGVAAFAGVYPSRDAPIVERMRAAGAIPIGHTNLPDFAIGWHTDSELWGATVNPWDWTRTPGASSGGEAAALATGMSPLGLGNDTLGSLRWPAQCCGVTALKPTLGRVPHATTVEPVDLPISNQLLGVEGPLARRVVDLRVAFEVLAGPSWRDPWTVPAPLRGPDLVRPIRVAVVVDPARQGTARQVREGVCRAGRTLAAAGYEVEEAEPPRIDVAASTHLDIFIPPIRAVWPTLSALFRPYTNDFVEALLEAAGERDAGASFLTRQSLQRAWGEFQERYPLIVAPVYTDVPFEVGRDRTTDEVAGILRGMRMVLAVNLLGLPAVSVPVGLTDGLPQSVQVIGPRFREDLCLDAAAIIETPLTPIDPR